MSSTSGTTTTNNEPTSKPTTAMCIAVNNLRKEGYADLEQWMAHQDNLYVGRRGRIFITDPITKEKRIFHYGDSKWGNPFKVGKGGYSLSESIALFRDRLEKTGLDNEVGELRGKTLGCFCDQSEICHAQVLADLANKKATT